MATNPPTGDGHRKCAVRQRLQVKNPVTGIYTKRDTKTGVSWMAKRTARLSKA